MADSPFSDAHYLLAGALKVAPAGTHPRRPFHGGGPALKIDAEAYVHGVLWLASFIDRFVDPRDRADFDIWVDLARQQLKVGPSNTTNQRILYSADAAKVSRIPAKVGAWCAHEASNWAWRAIYAGGAARPAAANVARFLAKSAIGELAGYLADLDAQCLQLEVMTQLREKKQTTTAPVAKVLCRGYEPTKVLFWLMRLENQKLALLFKEKTRWRLLEGDKDEVLATVPEAHFERAVHAAHAFY